jgi:hypothetical protein
VKLQARVRRDQGLAYHDSLEKLKYSASLDIKEVRDLGDGACRQLDWFQSPYLRAVRGLPEVNLLSEYENPDLDSRVEFWMEPGETYRLCAPVALPAGSYIAKVTFVGTRRGEFWSTLTAVTIPHSS